MKDQLWLVSPFESPDVDLAVAADRAGAFPALHLGRNLKQAESALRSLSGKVSRFGVCIDDAALLSISLPPQVTKIIMPWRLCSSDSAKLEMRRPEAEVWWQVRSADETAEALDDGESRLILKGREGVGYCGEESSLVLFLQLVKLCKKSDAAVRVQGGVGVHTAAAYLALGAEGVLLDSQLALFPECGAPAELKAALGKLGGGEIHRCEGYQYWPRPGVRDTGELSLAQLLAKVGHTGDAEFVPVGQDVILAAGYASGYGRIKNLVRAFSRAAASHPMLALTRDAFAAKAGMAEQLQTEYPIAQGPMARISDVPEFLKSVADGGALPFLAMSLTVGDAAEEMLTKTAALMDGKPWGVGMLGFAYPQVLAEQTERILRAKPSVVLIAGGRPTQARPFEQAGIKVFLHVPAPGLLDMYLKEGARSFIFEGRESGGHVGPLYSTLLWERQIGRLLEQDGAEALSVFFAGGIYNALSAAFVRIMAAPLTARDVNVGILMGTAYLNTEEIVETGAVTKEFQKTVFKSDQTILIQSGSGQETRAVPSPYTEFFLGEKQRMKDQGMDSTEIIMKLEDLNLGRLRIASKGTSYKEGKLVALTPKEQREDGLFMAGAVSPLIKRRTTIKKLHEAVISGSLRLIEGLGSSFAAASEKTAASETANKAGNTDFAEIAVIGMAGLFPDAENLDEYWRNIVLGKNSISEVN
ncbi:MAG: hypothetical protein LBU58_06110, partial [Clostridiales bacterium]|nr:hypothetical protein [Clostridiales bacterium]